MRVSARGRSAGVQQGLRAGQHLVDESLILNFQALTAGWPLYGNDNGHWECIIQYNEEWLKSIPGGNARTPDYRIATGQNTVVTHNGQSWRGDTNILSQQVSFGPQSGDPEFGRPEITAGRAGTLNGRIVGLVSKDLGDTKQPFFLSDFVLRSAEMTGQLDTVLDQLSLYIERDMEARSAIKSALTYPIIVLFMSIMTMVVMVFRPTLSEMLPLGLPETTGLPLTVMVAFA